MQKAGNEHGKIKNNSENRQKKYSIPKISHRNTYIRGREEAIRMYYKLT